MRRNGGPAVPEIAVHVGGVPVSLSPRMQAILAILARDGDAMRLDDTEQVVVKFHCGRQRIRWEVVRFGGDEHAA